MDNDVQLEATAAVVPLGVVVVLVAMCCCADAVIKIFPSNTCLILFRSLRSRSSLSKRRKLTEEPPVPIIRKM